MKLNFLLAGYFIFFLLNIYGCRDAVGGGNQPELIIQPPSEGSKITVTDPGYDQIFNPGDSIIIKWVAPTIERIDLQLFRKSNYEFTLVEKIENNGIFIWKIPFDITFSHHYRIKIRSNSHSYIYEFSNQFGIL